MDDLYVYNLCPYGCMYGLYERTFNVQIITKISTSKCLLVTTILTSKYMEPTSNLLVC